MYIRYIHLVKLSVFAVTLTYASTDITTAGQTQAPTCTGVFCIQEDK
jgi:hypothetical protein